MPSRTRFFRQFSSAHSWYKHIPLPREFGITVWVDAAGLARWGCFDLSDLLQEGGRLYIKDERMRQAAVDNSLFINGLVYGEPSGFEHTVEIGGDPWFDWLEANYPDDVAWVKSISTRRDKPDFRGEHWTVGIKVFDKSVKVRIAALKAKEYARLLAEFKAKAERVWAVYVETLR